MYKKYFDAHFHWFDHSAFSDRLSSNIGDLDTKEYFLETYGRYGMTGGIMMGNGEIEKQGDSLPDGFYYCVGRRRLGELRFLFVSTQKNNQST